MARLDHLVYGTPDLASSTAEVAARLGVSPVVGGRHVGRGSANTLLALGDGAYLEIVGPDPEQRDHDGPRPFGIDTLLAPRLITFAVSVTSIEEAAAAARRGGYDPGSAKTMQRATPEGGLLSWTLTDPPLLGDGLVPFLIDWGATIHPSATIGATTRLSRFSGEHPHEATVNEALRAIGFDFEVRHGTRPRLVAEIDGPGGRMILSSDVLEESRENR